MLPLIIDTEEIFYHFSLSNGGHEMALYKIQNETLELVKNLAFSLEKDIQQLTERS